MALSPFLGNVGGPSLPCHDCWEIKKRRRAMKKQTYHSPVDRGPIDISRRCGTLPTPWHTCHSAQAGRHTSGATRVEHGVRLWKLDLYHIAALPSFTYSGSTVMLPAEYIIPIEPAFIRSRNTLSTSPWVVTYVLKPRTPQEPDNGVEIGRAHV